MARRLYVEQMNQPQNSRGLTRRSFVTLSAAAVAASTLGASMLTSETAAAAGAYRHPFNESWWIPQDGEWGNRASWRSFPPHAGVDYNVAGGTAGKTVRAIGPGVIRGGGWSSTYGNRVWIQHDDGWWSHYAHFQSAATRGNGEWVAAGTPIGLAGNTGSASNGPHLHLEVSRTQFGCNNYSTSVNPITFIDNNTGPSPEPPANNGAIIIKRNNNMASLYYTTVNNVTTFALAGDGVGQAGWLETTDQQLANQLALQHGNAAYLTPGSFNQWKGWYLGQA